ncbi:MAG TPA: DUF5666 domain-containing protein, partial [Candidatus Acidoferrum sp.]|nr:DUF5666 domain-containing protein [Candidatus Acidoferrum sp.]
GPVRKQAFLIATIYASFSLGSAAISQAGQARDGQPSSAQTPAAARPVGTIKSISGNTITLTTDAGSDVTVQVQEVTKLIRIAPGQKDLKDATPIQLADLQVGDRILVRGKLANDGKSVVAASVIAMKKLDIAEKQAHDREEWQRHGFGGLVNSVDAASGTIGVALPPQGERKSIAIHLSKDIILRRYALDSVMFDDAKPAPLDQIKPGDQLRARGTRSADGAEFTADEIVSGTFRNIAGTISALDASAGTITVQDLVAKKPITVRITPESQLRKLPPQMAQRIAARLKGTTPEVPSSPTTPSAEQTARPSAPPTGGPGTGGSGGMGRSGGGGTADLQQMINRMPAAALADLQKGDAVMVVATESGTNGVSTVITLLGGVEPILEASPKSSASTILSPWSLSSGGGGEAATP